VVAVVGPLQGALRPPSSHRCAAIETIEATVADSADDPEIALQKKSRSELLRQAVMKLSPDHREIIDLIYYHEKSVDDCALILGIPAATVKTRMFYARKKLAELVQPEAH
jgi:RNA polymerase sigma-70 factor (ECF subfamily)